jgi:hypothetical protein
MSKCYWKDTRALSFELNAKFQSPTVLVTSRSRAKLEGRLRLTRFESLMKCGTLLTGRLQ